MNVLVLRTLVVPISWFLLGAGTVLTGSVCAQTDVSSLDYRRAWPLQVPVSSPDPVLGKEKYWEYWVFDKTFSERFDGFDSTKANPEMARGVHALVFRTYMRKLFDEVPELYACEYEIYFDSDVKIPLSERTTSYTYPTGVTHSFRHLKPRRSEDAQYLANATSGNKAPKSWPLIFADGKLDGRYGKFTLRYFPDLLPGVAMATLGDSDFFCRVLGPKRPDSRLWVWLFGELPYNADGSPLIHKYSDRFMKWLYGGSFDPGSVDDAISKGRVLVPTEFYSAVLSKVTLIKAINQCIIYRSGYQRGTIKDINGSKKRNLAACDEVEKKGDIYEIAPRGVLKGWQEVGF